ncbi:MAG: bifunctional phosphopantothenoylcysteine decarboxylase/phosphopantothenate--cysteine ligase CoaBC [Gammaproteobacteria bacterium]|nr:bifunctional phosphopantothenoylcysteine decarboxylase/phosphopantothenate--cysteine ligase CoaBC [Gammaproteobacteria bacterium]MDT8372046.1 bifunctional phosphopantothenoylcysteine decarboxylase/phosphopantothenate--cysteine ligase CoaBC [Gammaproteobacteria bacterium]
MNMHETLLGKKIVLGVTGSIAAYKSAELIRRMKELGADVRVVMTKAACEFITPLTLQTLSGQPVAIELLDADQESAMGHIKLARWADWIVIAPASANTIARLAHGQTDDLLSSLCLASESPLALAPAMNNKMWANEATQANLDILMKRGVHVLGPASGDQACGEQGEGRLLEPMAIIAELAQLMMPLKLQGKKVVITAGPTYEPIDPVRFIGNRSSGKMGFAVAKAAKEAGANVVLIAGPVHLTTPPGVERINVETAAQMHEQVMASVASAAIFIACAAVADFRPQSVADNKIKKTQTDNLQLELVPTTDSVSEVVKLESVPFIVGFAAETEHVADYAQTKLHTKKLDMIAANQVGEGLGFAVDDNALDVFWSEGSQILPLANKTQLARDLMTLIIEQFYAKNSTQST